MEKISFKDKLDFALNGIRSTWQGEQSFRIQGVTALAITLVLIALKATPEWWALILLTVGSVLSAEMFNTALEHLVDRLHPENHPEIKLVKDCAAGAVLILSFISIGVFVALLVQTGIKNNKSGAVDANCENGRAHVTDSTLIIQKSCAEK